MQRSKLAPFPLLAVAAALVLGLAGCGSPDAAETPEPQQDDTTTQVETPAASSEESGEAILSYGDTTYTAQLQYCSLDGGEDALFHGPAHDEDGTEVGYLDGDFGGLTDAPHGEARIDFGATDKLQSTDEFVAMGTAAGHIVVTDSSESSLIIVGGVWDEDDTPLATATLRVSC